MCILLSKNTFPSYNKTECYDFDCVIKDPVSVYIRHRSSVATSTCTHIIPIFIKKSRGIYVTM